MRAARGSSLALLGACSLAACAHVDQGRYGITSIEIEGNQALDSQAIEACLISRERPDFSIKLGLSSPTCGKPPFDSSPPTLRLWRWPWTDWPAFNEAVFENDVERVTRFYRARGYYGARVVKVEITPPEAQRPGKVGDCDPKRETCKVSILIAIDEGLPTKVESVEVRGLSELPAEVRERAMGSLPIARGDVVDETFYEQGKANLVKELRLSGHAAAEVEGRVEVSTRARTARVVYVVTPGPVYRIGKVTVAGNGTLPANVIAAAASLSTGDRYDPKALSEAQGEVYAMGAFSAAQIHESLRPEAKEVDIEIQVTPLDPNALRLSVGVMSGGVQRTSTSELQSVPQWDVHLLASYERRHLFGSLARVRVEERPRVIYNRDFPRVAPPTFGNIVKLTLTHPGLLERRTESFFESAWDYGPEPFLQFIRSDIYFRVGARRRFFRGTLTTTLALQQDVFYVDPSPDNVSSDGEPQDSYRMSYVEQDVRVDFRDDVVRPKLGAYFGVHAAEAVRWKLSDWTAYFLSPEARGYLPLFWDVVWASRFGL
ncbi:MAG TPA: POTRA domain-containing protein, partial [Polyangiaceae bacterium]